MKSSPYHKVLGVQRFDHLAGKSLNLLVRQAIKIEDDENDELIKSSFGEFTNTCLPLIVERSFELSKALNQVKNSKSLQSKTVANLY